MRERIERVEDLEVFRRAYRLSLEIHKSSLALPRIEQFALADQLRRSSKSICANLAEGFAKAEPFCGGVPALPDGRDRQQ